MSGLIKRWFDRVAPGASAALRDIRDAASIRNAPFVRTPHGFRFRGNEIMATGAFEPEETAFVDRVLGECDVFVDIGANIGFFSCLARSKGKPVVAVEPLPQNVTVLCANLVGNGWADAEVYPVGLSDRPRIATLYGGGTGASLLPAWSGVSPSRRRDIPLTTLDIILDNRFSEKRLFIKIDVEGAELDLLRGAATTLARSPRPMWMIEVCFGENFPPGKHNPHFVAVFELFAAANYRAYSVGKELRPVTLADVRSWAERGERDFGYVTYAFRAD
jgi:FkbM family methyltransferase